MTQTVNSDRGSATEVAIIGAGPYGLSIAAHLASKAIPFRIFGQPMSAWSTQMPKGMHLKSEGFASSLSDPRGSFPIREYCKQQGIPYEETGLPVAVETFVNYGTEFQKRFVPGLEQREVISVLPSSNGFELELDNEEKVYARKVVVATGISRFAYLPEILSSLPRTAVTHSSAHSNLERFRNLRVAVVGSGSSALDLLTLLYEGGAHPELISRSSAIRFHDPPRARSLKQRILQPRTGLGLGIELVFCVNAPRMFRLLPESLRLDRVRKVLGPAPGWFVRDRIEGKVPFHLHSAITSANIKDGKVVLEVKSNDGLTESLEFDHVIAATGYRVNVERLEFISPVLRNQIRLTGKAPALTANFESTVPGLYFVGVTAANTFGPLMRFAYGSSFTSAALARHLSKQATRVQPLPNRDKAEICERS